MKTSTAIGVCSADLVYLRGKVEKALCPQEKAHAAALVKGEAQGAYERVYRVIGGCGFVDEITRAAFAPETLPFSPTKKQTRSRRVKS